MSCYDTYHIRYVQREKRRNRLKATAVMGLIAAAYILASTIDYKEQEEAYKQRFPMIKSHNSITDKEEKLTSYFRKKGSPNPQAMAEAVLRTKSPRLMAAIATIETNGNPTKRNTGYRKQHSGAFQVNKKYWGPVSTNPVQQALQAENALEEFIKQTGSIEPALNGYGGDKTKKEYSRTILAELINVPKL